MIDSALTMADRCLQERLETTTVRLGRGGRLPLLRLEEPQIKVVAGPDQGLSVPFTGPRLRVGTSTENDLVLGDPAVSRFHFSIELEGNRTLLRDPGSTNGTRVDGVLVREALLEPGARITVGETTLEIRSVVTQVPVTPGPGETYHGLIGPSVAMRELFGYLDVVSRTALTVVLQGETGSGKELVARALHDASPRARGPFTVFDCGAVDASLVGAALFGHVPGAFTGAVGTRRGAFQSAHRGTLFLDEIGELPLDQQPRLLRALERREVQPLGSDAPVGVDVRIVCATHRNLAALADEGRFRADLLFRLAGVVLVIPPLRDRSEDVAALARHFLASARPELELGADALSLLQSASWPGNVRELRSAIERSAALARGPIVGAGDLVLNPLRPGDPAGTPAPALESIIVHAEGEAIRRALRDAGGNKSVAARVLGIARSTLRKKMSRYDIEDS